MGTTDTVNLMAGATLTVLGTVLHAGYKQDAAGQTYFVFQDVAAANDGVSVSELIHDVQELMGYDPNTAVPGLSEADVKAKLDSVSDSNSTYHIEAVRIKLRTVYLKIDIPTTGPKIVEYAFQLDVSAVGLIPQDIHLINIDSLTIAVWNTTNPVILKQMALLIESA